MAHDASRSPIKAYTSPFGLKRDMGYSRQDFCRLLPSAFSDYAVSVQDNCVSIQLEKGQVLMKIGSERERRLSDLIRFPVLPIEIEFVDADEAEQALFLRQFDLSYMKGLA